MSRPRLMVVDDVAATLEVLERQLEACGYEVLTAADVESALDILERESVDLVITDLRMPGPSGLELIRHLRGNRPELEVMMITGYASIEGAVEAVKTGAAEYLAKPFTRDELAAAVERALAVLERRRAATASLEGCALPLLAGCGPEMLAVRQAIARAAHSLQPVLIDGERGSGHGAAARAIHDTGSQADGPFICVAVNLLPAGRATAELNLLAERADGGTLVLETVDRLDEEGQIALLRLINERSVHRRSGGGRRRIRLRVVATTTRDLSADRAAGRFRGDLLDRLGAIRVHLPPMRDLGEDLPRLVHALLAGIADRRGGPVPRVSDPAMTALETASWPGNLDELEAAVEVAVENADGDVVSIADLPPRLRFNVRATPLSKRTLADVESEHLRAVLEHVGGNKSEAARILGIDRKTLRDRLRRS